MLAALRSLHLPCIRIEAGDDTLLFRCINGAFPIQSPSRELGGSTPGAYDERRHTDQRRRPLTSNLYRHLEPWGFTPRTGGT